MDNIPHHNTSQRKCVGCNKSRGFTLIEAMVATAIMSIGFVGVYSLVAFSERSIRNSTVKQKLFMQANQIYEIIESDVENIDLYSLDLTVCNPLGPGDTATWQVRRFEWCSRLNGELGVATNNETRSITVTQMPDGRRVVHILLEDLNGDVQIVMKRVFDS